MVTETIILTFFFQQFTLNTEKQMDFVIRRSQTNKRVSANASRAVLS